MDINKLSKEERYKKLRSEPYHIRYVHNPSEKEWRIALSRDISLYKFIQNPDDNVEQFMVRQKPNHIRNIKNPSSVVQCCALMEDPSVIIHIENPTYQAKKVYISRKPHGIKYLFNPDDELKMLALEHDPRVFYKLLTMDKTLSEAVQLKAVSCEGTLISEIINPSEAVQVAAVKQNSASLTCITYPCYDAILEAVRETPIMIFELITDTIVCEDEIDDTIQLEAVKNSWNRIIYNTIMNRFTRDDELQF